MPNINYLNIINHVFKLKMRLLNDLYSVMVVIGFDIKPDIIE